MPKCFWTSYWIISIGGLVSDLPLYDGSVDGHCASCRAFYPELFVSMFCSIVFVPTRTRLFTSGDLYALLTFLHVDITESLDDIFVEHHRKSGSYCVVGFFIAF